MSFHRMRPPLNRQDRADSCWAAALDSFSRVTHGMTRLHERDLIARYGTGTTGGLNAANLERLRAELAQQNVRIALITNPSMPYDIEDRLRLSHVVCAGQQNTTQWHAWLIYGIDSTFVMYMEPRNGTYGRVNWASSGFVSNGGYYMFWRP